MNSLWSTPLVPDFLIRPCSVVGVDICLIFILAALLEAFLVGAILLPLAAPGRASGGASRGLVAVAARAERHPRVEVRLLPLQQFP